MRTGWILSSLLVVLGLMPGTIALASRALAAVAGCRLMPITPTPCLVFGSDWGAGLHLAAGLNWLSVFGVPVAVVGFAWAIVLAVIDLRRRLRQ